MYKQHVRRPHLLGGGQVGAVEGVARKGSSVLLAGSREAKVAGVSAGGAEVGAEIRVTLGLVVGQGIGQGELGPGAAIAVAVAGAE